MNASELKPPLNDNDQHHETIAAARSEDQQATSGSGRNLIICCDGTNNEFGTENTNVVRLIQVLDRNPLKQRLYYDPGVGTLPEPGAFGVMRKWMSQIAGLAFGAGLDWKVQEAYTYLMEFWEPGDRVFIFGFSRGAYAARVLAGMLHAVGLLPRGSYNLVPYAMRIFKAVRKERVRGATDEWAKLCADFRWTFSRPVFEGDSDRRFPVHFLGVWDTVSSVGWVWDPEKFPYTARNPSISIIRHAVSIDERRWFFRQNLMKQADAGQDFLEVWFPGVHCDVGGGYPPKLENQYAELWRVAFDWMRMEAEKAGLLIDSERLKVVLSDSPLSPRPVNDRRHESLKGAWLLAEYFPKQVWDSSLQKRKWDIGRCRCRVIPDTALLHKAVLLRLRDNTLPDASPNICPSFRESVKSLSTVPETLAYSEGA